MTKAELARYVDLVRKRKRRNPDSPLWVTLEGRWRTVVENCEGVLADAMSGKPMNRHQRNSCQEIVQVAENVEPAEVIETALGMYLMHEMSARRFRSDEAFWHQLARRVRGLTEVNAGTWFDHTTGKVKRVYRDLPASTSLIIGKALAEAFGAAGLMLARKETQDAEKRAQERQDIARAIQELT